MVVKRNWIEKFQLNLTLVNHPSCYGQRNGRVAVSMSGGLPPYSFVVTNASVVAQLEERAVLTGGGVVTVIGRDSMGCSLQESVEVFAALPFVGKFYYDTDKDASRW